MKKTPVKSNKVEEGRDRSEQLANKVTNKESGDWQPASEKRGRAGPSPDKVHKQSEGRRSSRTEEQVPKDDRRHL